MKRTDLKCYMCEEDAVGVEHVPPKSLFPKSKDVVSGKNFRVNLLTVPSCAKHNSDKSCDDQYFLNVLTGCAQINSIGLEHYRNQLRRQNLRNPSLLQRLSKAAFETNGGLGFEVEIERLTEFIHHLAYALFYSHFASKWNGGVEWFPEFLSRYPDDIEETFRLNFIRENDVKFSSIKNNGSNPEVFSYQVIVENSDVKMRLSFYDGCKILLIYTSEA